MAEATNSLTRRTAAGMASSTTAMILTSGFQVVYTVVMARLLTPREFGLVAMANVVIGLTAQFSRFGVGPALIQHPQLNQALIRSATALSWILGVVGTVAIVALSPVAGWFFDEPAVVPVLMALAIAVTVAAVALVPEALLRRALRFQWLAGVDVASFAIGYLGVGIVSAAMGAGVWSLVAATLSQAVLKAIALLFLERQGLRPGWSRDAVRRIASFGSQVTAIGLMYYAVTSLPTLLIGRFLGSSSLGQYNRADLLIRLPTERLTNSISHVVFPALASVNLEARRFVTGYSIAVGGAAALVLPTAVFFALMAEPIVALMLGPGWETSAAVLPVISIAAAASYVTRLFGVSLEALGRLKGKLVTGFVVLALSAALLPVAAQFGLRAVAAVVAAVELLRFGVFSTLLSRVEGFSLQAVLLPFVPGLLLAVAVAGVVLPLVLLAPAWSAPTTVLAAMLASIVGIALAQLLPPVAELRRVLLIRLRLARAGSVEYTEHQTPDAAGAAESDSG